MRLAVLLALLVVVASPLAIAAERVQHEGWVEFVPDWREGPGSVTFQNRTLAIPANVTYATDGESYLYAVEGSDAEAHDAQAKAACATPVTNPGYDIVVVDARVCAMSRHPGMACSGTVACCATGQPLHATPGSNVSASACGDLPPVLTHASSCDQFALAMCKTPGFDLAMAAAAVVAAVGLRAGRRRP